MTHSWRFLRFCSRSSCDRMRMATRSPSKARLRKRLPGASKWVSFKYSRQTSNAPPAVNEHVACHAGHRHIGEIDVARIDAQQTLLEIPALQ